MQLQIWMVTFSTDYITEITGINPKTVNDWKRFMSGEKEDLTKRENTKPEAILQERFVKSLTSDYEEYVRTPTGIIDVLTEKEIFEIKVSVSNSTIYKPFGQLIIYSKNYPRRKKVIVAKKVSLSKEIMAILRENQIDVIHFDN